MRIYHKDVYMPILELEEFWKDVHTLIPTKHFLKRQEEKNIPLPTIDELKNSLIFEVGIEFDELLKVCYRIRGDKDKDYCYAIRKGGIILTAWTQNVKDSHSNLDKSKYWKE